MTTPTISRRTVNPGRGKCIGKNPGFQGVIDHNVRTLCEPAAAITRARLA